MVGNPVSMELQGWAQHLHGYKQAVLCHGGGGRRLSDAETHTKARDGELEWGGNQEGGCSLYHFKPLSPAGLEESSCDLKIQGSPNNGLQAGVPR